MNEDELFRRVVREYYEGIDLYVKVHDTCGVRAVNILKNNNVKTEEQLKFILKTTNISLKWYLCGKATESKLRELFDIPNPVSSTEDVRIKAIISQIRNLSIEGKLIVLRGTQDAIQSEEA